MVHRLNRLCGRDDGAMAIVTVLLISMVFIGLTSLVVDLGMARDTRRQAQNAADASALAAGNVLYLTGTVDITRAISAAKSYAATNYGVTVADWAACTDASALTYHPDTGCISFDNASTPATVRVTVPVRQVNTPFAQIWGVSSVPVSTVAQIQLVPPGGLAACGLCIVGSGTHNLQNGAITISGANVAINGTLAAGPQGSITVTGSGVSIGLQGDLPNQGTYSPTPLVNQSPVIDPLVNLSMPDYSSLLPKTNSCTQGPGIYASLDACSNMLPGLYVLTGSTSLEGNNSIVANGVTLYFVCGTPTLPRACTTGESGGSLDFGGNATLNITAPTTGPTQGLSIVADRSNTATFSFGGNGAQTNSGTIYALSGTLAYNGNGAGGNLDSLVIVGDLSLDGNPAVFQSSYTQAANVVVPFSGLRLSY